MLEEQIVHRNKDPAFLKAVFKWNIYHPSWECWCTVITFYLHCPPSIHSVIILQRYYRLLTFPFNKPKKDQEHIVFYYTLFTEKCFVAFSSEVNVELAIKWTETLRDLKVTVRREDMWSNLENILWLLIILASSEPQKQPSCPDEQIQAWHWLTWTNNKILMSSFCVI